jgi:hypothetical protein
MAEAWGKIVIKASEELLSPLADSEDGIDGQTMLEFFSEVGADTEAAPGVEPLSEDDEWAIERIELFDDHLRIDSFGDEWMGLMEALVKSARGIEVYGSINHEHGGSALFALDRNGEPFYAEVSDEGEGDPNAEVSDEELSEQWRALIPADFADYVFGDEDEDEDADYDDEDDRD